MEEGTTLVWDEIKRHINPSEVDAYARRIGLAKISRNEEAFQELTTLINMKKNIQADLSDEIENKSPLLLTSTSRKIAIDKAIRFLDSIRSAGHCVEPSNDNDSQVINYLKLTKLNRPRTSTPVTSPRRNKLRNSTRSISTNLTDSIDEIKSLLDDEYAQIQLEIQEVRSSLFGDVEQLEEIKSINPPTTDSIESFNKRMRTKEITLKNMSKVRSSSSVLRLRESVRMNRMWE
ncbi:hypothetical protein GPJ56_010527 [Histomonas meleagridis]|uniref:uncharacterized protein n=1 Tax=Histomonas meleagridis TaxID=135588 RepID=UPI00355A7199|nr:hypothetical protein GPJ56_010527 [Histomonas meleagridis]KAH0798016.1 hypothetical protein GO595_009235 [Histomonas meleagridis]